VPEEKDSYTKFEETQERYWKSEKGREAKRRYNLSDAGKNSRERYLKSEKGQEALLRYYLSEQAETTRQKRQALIKLFRLIDKYIKNHPDVSPMEALEQLTKKEL